mmetsp:Transcript_46157/g.72237  ORF Transcript_46157/g.72237 Transcript_46157/m.72237 type:complete len:130 (-) Transcript_46157:290-679(-)
MSANNTIFFLVTLFLAQTSACLFAHHLGIPYPSRLHTSCLTSPHWHCEKLSNTLGTTELCFIAGVAAAMITAVTVEVVAAAMALAMTMVATAGVVAAAAAVMEAGMADLAVAAGQSPSLLARLTALLFE